MKMKLYRTIILHHVLFWHATWSLILREEHRLRVFESVVLRKILGCKKDEVMGEWRRLHSEEFHGLYILRSVTWVIKFMSGACGMRRVE
jgi:hypothetical protein